MGRRHEIRRPIYLGEQISCAITNQLITLKADLYDLSQRGFAFVLRDDRSHPVFKEGERIVAMFERAGETGFSVAGTIRNRKSIRTHRGLFQRYGVQTHVQVYGTYQKYSLDLPGKFHHCRTYVRPQVACRDPFFFDETLLFQVNGFSPAGIDLIVSSRCKSMLPNLPISFDIFMPGRGAFEVEAKVGHFQFHSKTLDRFRIFMSYVHASAAFHEAVAEYLLMFAQQVSPNQLEAEGFRVGNIGLAIAFQGLSGWEEFAHFRSTALAASGARGADLFDPHSRKFVCRLGPYRVACFRLIFVDGDSRQSEAVHHGHTLPRHVLSEGHLELSRLLLSQGAKLKHVFVPLLRHAVRIAAQSQIKYIVVEARSEVRPLLEKVGFELQNSTCLQPIDGLNVEFQLAVLKVDQALANAEFKIPASVWKNLYEDLNAYLSLRRGKPRLVGRTYLPLTVNRRRRARRKDRAS